LPPYLDNHGMSYGSLKAFFKSIKTKNVTQLIPGLYIL